jgi:cytochrome b6-f complex iron-sulfur subunit
MNTKPEHSTNSPIDDIDSQFEAAQQLVEPSTRRSLFGRVTSIVMACGMALGYGMFGWVLSRFLYPNRGQQTQWQYLARLATLDVGQSLTYESPSGHQVVVTRLEQEDASESFIALSSVCPHLGCQVHWEQTRDRFFCPCHNGAFDANGQPLEGPPKTANQSLPRYPLKVEHGLLFIDVPTERLV